MVALPAYLESLNIEGPSATLVCPTCGNTQTHFGGQPTVHPFDGSHESVRVLFYGACLHQWVWVFTWHAGRVDVSLEAHTPR
jgi:hypothetical protein